MEDSAMTLPSRNEKDYLEIKSTWTGFSIQAQKRHADELEPLFAQRGLPCRRQAGTRPGEEALRFDNGIDRAKVSELIQGYKEVKGS
jgi:hypothetical protein